MLPPQTGEDFTDLKAIWGATDNDWTDMKG